MNIKNRWTRRKSKVWKCNSTTTNQSLTKKQFNKDKTLYQSNLAPYGETTFEFCISWEIFSFIRNIISFIFTESKSKFNYAEVEFHFPLANQRNSYAQNNTDNIINIFIREDLNKYFIFPSITNCYFGFEVKHIEINPTKYSIGILKNPDRNSLTSFVLEGYNEKNDTWDVIDKENIDNAILEEGIHSFEIKPTDQKYSIFILRQTAPGTNGFWGFSLPYFDIDGYIMIKDNLNDEKSSTLNDDDDRDGIESI